ncbi:hypothetical protein KP001_09885 [Geomonas subterranea]|uniref:Four helix bundle sensory module for signal transduction n=1 Tax=Geomonas subterranea TaxID=2847989 RepID=A0ABX8LR88_9BACT|nr:hypothetical protein [Geomonas subterranea]QXE92799.1 hypothetical protein KP001_09885 [Geomonas subterranea]QXM09098.1 hypothetical protein KP002_19390 [Geomonas subterranea]
MPDIITDFIAKNPTALTALGAISAALLTGAFSFIFMIISKENETSKFRQAWIDELRRELSTFISATETLANITYNYNKENAKRRLSERKGFHKFTAENADLLSKLLSNYRSIVLRLNNSDHGELEIKLAAVYKEFRKHPVDPRALRRLNEEVTALSRSLLKSEWTRVKEGEPAFYWTKRILVFMTSCAVITGIYLILQIKLVG